MQTGLIAWLSGAMTAIGFAGAIGGPVLGGFVDFSLKEQGLPPTRCAIYFFFGSLAILLIARVMAVEVAIRDGQRALPPSNPAARA